MKLLNLIWIIPLVLIVSLFFIRLFNHVELDDVTPGIPCDAGLIKNADTLWVIPDFNNVSISNNQTWCKEILSMNKTLGMHGVEHKYREFGGNVTKEELVKGMNDFKTCFGFYPTMFKPPQLKISGENKKLIEESGMTLKLNFNQIIHKVYHCNDSDIIKNRWIKIF